MMERGVIQLTVAERQHALQALQAVEGDEVIGLLKERLTNGSDQENIQLREEDAEIILDNLPMPQAGEAADITSLRKKVQQFIAKIRFPEATNK